MRPDEHVPLAPFSTLHVGGEARYFLRVGSLERLLSALRWAEDHQMPWRLLGGGANMFCRPEGFPGLVLKMEARGLAIKAPRSERSWGELTAEAGVLIRLAASEAVRRGFRGLEHLAGIPGTIGGAVRGNAGSFGTETADHLVRARVVRKTVSGWEEEVLPKSQLQFSYRDSLIKREPQGFVVWNATFALPPGDIAAGDQLIREDLMVRREKQPYEFPSVGSVFKNPSPEQPAGALIERAGLKGLRHGGAEVSLKHANFIVNRGEASAADVLLLIEDVKARVFENSGVRLEEEIVIL